MLQIPVVLQSRVRTVQTVQTPEMPQRSSWSGCSRARCYAVTVAWVWTVPKTVGVPQLPLVQFLEVIDTPVVLVTTGAYIGPDSAEIHRDFTRAVLDKAVDMPLVCRNCGGSAVAVHRQVWFTCLIQRLVPMVQTVQLGLAAHFLDDELWVFFRALYTGTGPGVVSTGTRPP